MPNGQDTDDKLRDREPVAFNSAITDSIKTFVLAVVALGVGFEWVNWTEAQTALSVQRKACEADDHVLRAGHDIDVVDWSATRGHHLVEVSDIL